MHVYMLQQKKRRSADKKYCISRTELGRGAGHMALVGNRIHLYTGMLARSRRQSQCRRSVARRRSESPRLRSRPTVVSEAPQRGALLSKSRELYVTGRRIEPIGDRATVVNNS